MLDTLKQLFKFMKVYKKFWLAPIVLALLILGSLLIAVENTAVAPFIYAIF